MKLSLVVAVTATSHLIVADSWVYWQCDTFMRFCLSPGDYQAVNWCLNPNISGIGDCVAENSYWVQYSGQNGGGIIVKHALAMPVDKKQVAQDPANAVCPPNDELIDDGNFAAIYKYHDPHIPGGQEPCPEGDLFEPDGRTLLGHDDGSGTLPSDGQSGSGFCEDKTQTCICRSTVALNSP